MILKSPIRPSGWLEECLAPHANDSYPGFLRRRMTEPGKTALIGRDRSLTYAQLHSAIDAAAAVLNAQYKIRPGDRVVLNMDNSIAMVVCYLAIHRAGGVAVPINPKLVGREISFVVSDAKPSLYIGEAARLVDVRALCEEAALPVVDAASLEREGSVDATISLPDVEPDQPATIFYTSGTTGSPKGVIHTHRTLTSVAFQVAAGWGYDYPHTLLAVTPFFHVAAHSWFYPLLAFSGTLIVDQFGVERCLELIERHRAGAFAAVPAMLLMMASSELAKKFDTTSITRVCFGASPMPPDKLAAVQQLFPNAQFWHGMGQTESGGSISVLPPELAFSKNGSTGFPIPACEVRIVDDEGRDVAPNTPGEVLARGPNVMIGYLNRVEATAATLADGWLHTGDVGYVDDDGAIYLVDRKKDMIIRGGENIYSVEIENLIMSHEGVEGCAIIGLPHPVLGETICAAIFPKGTAQAGLIDELTALCRRDLAGFKVPEIWRFVDDLPRTPTGKIQKALVRDDLMKQAEPPTAGVMDVHSKTESAPT